MSATGYHMTTTPYHMTGSIGPASSSAYGGFFKSSLGSAAETGVSTSTGRMLHNPAPPPPPQKIFSALEPSKPSAYARGDKYATVTASDIRKIVDVSLATELSKSSAGRNLESNDLLFSKTGSHNSDPLSSITSKPRQYTDFKLDSSSTSSSSIHRPYSTSDTGRSTEPAKLVRSLTADGITKGLDRPIISGYTSSTQLPEKPATTSQYSSEHRPSTPFHGYDRIASATAAAMASDALSRDVSSGLPSSTSEYMSEKANYNTHQKYTSTSLGSSGIYSSLRGSSGLDSMATHNGNHSYLSTTTASDPETRKPEVGTDLSLGLGGISSHRVTPSRSKFSSDYKSLLNSPNDITANVPVDVTGTSVITTNSSRYLDTGLKFLAPSPPKTPFPGRSDPSALSSSSFKGYATEAYLSGKDSVLESDTYARSLSASRLNGVNINSSFRRNSLSSPRETSEPAMPTHTGLTPAANTSTATSSVYDTLSRQISSAIDQMTQGYSHTLSSGPPKRSILKKVSSYGGDLGFSKSFSASTTHEVPMLHGLGGYRKEALPPLSTSPRGGGSLRRPVSIGKRVTFNMGQNTSHWYEAAEYDEPYYSPYIW